MENLNDKIKSATKWSTLTEIIAKLVSPISTIILARLLTPEAYGVVATITMIISFAELFTDAGFQRYIIQRDFLNKKEMFQTINVAFISNLLMSFLLWFLIIIFSDSIAIIVGNPGLGHVISISCISIPIAAFSSVQMALYKREFDFKSLFYVRLAGLMIPIMITVPLAFVLRNYWALIIGTIVLNVTNAIILTIKSKWKPRLYYNYRILKNMFSYCFWTLLDTILIWATNYVDIFFIGVFLSQYYLGLYKTSITTVGQITSLIVAGILPVMMPSFSRLQNNIVELRNVLLKFQKITALLLLPLGLLIFLNSEFITSILLGPQWSEASRFIGIWGLIEVITIIITRICTNIYPAIGKPNISVVCQILHILFLIPAIYIAVQYDFETLYMTRALCRLQAIIIHLFFVYKLLKLSPIRIISNISIEFVACILVSIISYTILSINDSILFNIISIIISCLVYLLFLLCFKEEKIIIKKILSFVHLKK